MFPGKILTLDYIIEASKGTRKVNTAKYLVGFLVLIGFLLISTEYSVHAMVVVMKNEASIVKSLTAP